MAKRLDLFVFADALGWKLAHERAFMDDLFPVRNACQTLFGYSSTCDPSILTGTYPDEHGHFSFFVKARGASPFRGLGALGWLPQRLAGYHRVRNRVSRLLGKHLGYTGYFQLYSVPFSRLPYLEYTEMRDIYEPGGIIGGQRTIFEHWEESGKPWQRSDWRAGDAANFARAGEVIDRGEAELVYLFTANLDAVMHRHGPQGPAVDEAFDAFEKDLRALHARALKQYAEVRVHLFSDHGMTRVHQGSDLLLRWRKLGYKYGRDYVAVWDSTMARFWFNSESVRQAASDWLAQQPEGGIVSDEQLAQWRCLFPDRRYGELFYLLPAGTIFVPSFLNQSLVAGMHGYDPAHPDSAACWLATHETSPVNDLPDIFRVMFDAAQTR
ncbi:MAG: alkaline phosphatase family protein [Puniceicoccales bacterium]